MFIFLLKMRLTINSFSISVAYIKVGVNGSYCTAVNHTSFGQKEQGKSTTDLQLLFPSLSALKSFSCLCFLAARNGVIMNDETAKAVSGLGSQ